MSSLGAKLFLALAAAIGSPSAALASTVPDGTVVLGGYTPPSRRRALRAQAIVNRKSAEAYKVAKDAIAEAKREGAALLPTA